jgi:hypothetical protein
VCAAAADGRVRDEASMSAAAARRAGRRGDGYFPGGRLTAAERAGWVELMRTAAAEGSAAEEMP